MANPGELTVRAGADGRAPAPAPAPGSDFGQGDHTSVAFPARFHILRRLGAGGMAEVFIALRQEADGSRTPVVIKRPLAGKGDERPTFQPTTFVPVAFHAWDGGAGETGAKMSLTSWYYLRLEPPQSNRRFVVPPIVAVLTLMAMLLVVRAVNRAR